MVNDRERLIVSDEMDLAELYKGLWRQRLLIVLCTTIVFLVAAGYAWKATPIYETKFSVQPPTQNDIANLNYGRGDDTGLTVLTVKDVYDVYLKHLQSESLRRDLFQSVYLPSLTESQRIGSQNTMFRQFNRSLTVALTGKEDPTRYSITATVSNPEDAVRLVTAYALKAGEQAKQEVLGNIKSDATVKANNLEREIDRQQSSSRKEREDQIVQLKEALLIAKSIGLEKPPIVTGKLSAEVSAGMDGSLMYMRGSKALEAEIDNLQKRQSDDPFISRLRQKQERLAFYRTLEIDPVTVAVFRQDGVVELPDQPIKPRKLIILALGLVFGFALGVSLALVRFLRRDKSTPQRSL